MSAANTVLGCGCCSSFWTVTFNPAEKAHSLKTKSLLDDSSQLFFLHPLTWSFSYLQQPVETAQSSAFTISSLPFLQTADDLTSSAFFLLYPFQLRCKALPWPTCFCRHLVNSNTTAQESTLRISLQTMPPGLRGLNPGCLGLPKALWFHRQALQVLWIPYYVEIEMISLQTQLQLI